MQEENSQQIYPPEYQQPYQNQAYQQQQYQDQGYQQQQYPQYTQQPQPNYNQNNAYNTAAYNYAEGFTGTGYGGYGDMYYNMYDPVLMKQNVPHKQDSSMHVNCIVGSIIFFAGVIVSGVGANNFLQMLAVGLIIGITYLIYLIAVICCSSIKGYITNLQKFDDYKHTYDFMVNAKGHFVFWIECYHYQTRTDSKGRTHRTKVVTHTATENCTPSLCVDQSGNLGSISDITKYVFINYLKKFYFTNDGSEERFKNAYNAFVARQRRDTHQNHSHTFVIPGFQEEVGFTALGAGSHNGAIFYITTILGLALPYSCILERAVSRYQINILKKLTM